MYPQTPNYGTGQFYGPTSQQSKSFPANVYLNLNDWGKWQLEVQIANNQAASDSFDATAKALGLEIQNPFKVYVQQAIAALAQYHTEPAQVSISINA